MSECFAMTRDFLLMLQAIIVIFVTLFTARWTYRTFAHKEKIQELKNLIGMIENYYSMITFHCARANVLPDEMENAEKMQIGNMHNELLRLASINLYTRPRFREQVQEIVGNWIARGRINKMAHRENSPYPREERESHWKQFNKEYQELKRLISTEAQKYV